MSTVEDAALGAIAAVGSDASVVLAGKWVAQRYRELADKVFFNHLRHLAPLEVPANLTDGTVTATRSSKIITGDATAQAAWSNALVGRWIRVTNVWYRIAAYQTTQLILDTPFAEDTASATAYTIAARTLFLSPNARHLGEWIIFPRRRRIVQRTNLEQMQLFVPDQRLIAGGPRIWAESGTGYDADGKRARTIDIYPTSEDTEVLYYIYWEHPPTLELDDELPVGVDEHVLREGVLVDVLRYEMAQQLRAGNIEGAALLRNEYRAQETTWERRKMDAIRGDRAADDLTFILSLTGGLRLGDFDIITAEDQVYSNWPK